MSETQAEVRIRPVDELDISGIVEIDEKISGEYRPEVWESRVAYYLRRDPEASLVAEADEKVVGFMLGEVRSGEFGLEEPTGWIEVLGVDPEYRRLAVGRLMAEQMIEYFRRAGASSVRTLVDVDKMAGIAGFFGSLGFAPGSLRSFDKRLRG